MLQALGCDLTVKYQYHGPLELDNHYVVAYQQQASDTHPESTHPGYPLMRGCLPLPSKASRGHVAVKNMVWRLRGILLTGYCTDTAQIISTKIKAHSTANRNQPGPSSRLMSDSTHSQTGRSPAELRYEKSSEEESCTWSCPGIAVLAKIFLIWGSKPRRCNSQRASATIRNGRIRKLASIQGLGGERL